MKYKATIKDTNGVKVIQVFDPTLEGIKGLAKQYLGMIDPGQTATIYRTVEAPIMEITSSQTLPLEFSERNLNEQD
jgi:hypothetical protein